jgi:hypothetical protein
VLCWLHGNLHVSVSHVSVIRVTDVAGAGDVGLIVTIGKHISDVLHMRRLVLIVTPIGITSRRDWALGLLFGRVGGGDMHHGYASGCNHTILLVCGIGPDTLMCKGGVYLFYLIFFIYYFIVCWGGPYGGLLICT